MLTQKCKEYAQALIASNIERDEISKGHKL